MKALGFLISAAFLAASALAADLAITSFERNGTLTWTNSISNAVYQVQWANAVTGPWTNFQALTALDSIQPTGSVTAVKVPTFYRVAATEPPPFNPDGIYRYTAFDTNGALLVIGWWEVNTWTNTIDGVAGIRGTWVNGYAGRFGAERDPSGSTGPQLGSGELAGSIYPIGESQGHRGWRAEVGLNPNVSDDNVGMRGDLDGRTFKGQWIWVTISGPPRPWAPFLLEKISPFPESSPALPMQFSAEKSR